MSFRLLHQSIPITIVPQIWIVDDDEDDRLLIRSAFDKVSIQVQTLDDGDQLLPALRKTDERPRLVLLDINMTRQNGFETLKELRSVPAYADLPVVMLTTSADEVDRKRCLALGADAFLTKPSDFEQLSTLTQQLTHQWGLS